MTRIPAYEVIINTDVFTRLFTMTYHESIMTVNIFDFFNEHSKRKFMHTIVDLHIRLFDDWKGIVNVVNLKGV